MTILHFLYHTIPGRVLLKLLTHPGVSKLCGQFLDSGASRFLIAPFVHANHITCSDYQLEEIHSFNDFFCRKIRPELRPIDMEPQNLIAPCDGLLSVWRIQKDTVLPVKQSHYTISSLLRDEQLAKRYDDGFCFVFRLCVEHYHRYCYADSGKKSKNRLIPGVLHTVRPDALSCLPVFTENSRAYTLIQTDRFGTLVQMEVGAMLVGRIVNHHQTASVIRGQKKGFFQYGGSTIILLVEKGRLAVRDELLKNAASGFETPIKMGEVIACAKIDPKTHS